MHVGIESKGKKGGLTQLNHTPSGLVDPSRPGDMKAKSVYLNHRCLVLICFRGPSVRVLGRRRTKIGSRRISPGAVHFCGLVKKGQ